MNCQSCRNEIEELELGESLSDEASAHVGVCSPCGAFYNERLSLKRLVGSLEPVSAPPDFEFRLRARLAASGNSGNHRHSFWRTFTSTPAIGFAAAFTLLVVGIVLYNQFKSAHVANNQSSGSVQQSSGQKSETTIVNPPPTTIASGGAPQVPERKNQQDSSPVIAPVAINNTHPHLAVNSSVTARRQRRQLDSGSTSILTNDMASRGAPQITSGSGSQLSVASNHVVELPVRSSAQPVRVFVGDKSGGKRAVTLEPVIFGSQDLTGRNDARTAAPQGIW